MVKVGAHYDDRVGVAGERANQVGLPQAFHRLFGEIAPLAPGGFKHGLQRGLALGVIALVALESLFDYFPLYGLELQLSGDRQEGTDEHERGQQRDPY